MSTSTQSQQQQQQQKQQQQGQQIPIHEASSSNQNQNQRTMQSNRNENQNQNQNQRSMQSNRNMNRNVVNRRNRNYNWFNDDMFDSPIERVFKSFLGDDYDNMSLMNRNNNNMGLNTPSFRANMIEKQNEYQVHGDLPGLNKQDINITFKDGTLEIEGKRENKVDEWDEKHQVHHKEVEYGTFYRSFYMPKSQNVNIKDVKAQYNNGVLNVHIPKDKQQDNQQYRVNID
jgi:HSP20 family protein